MTTYLKKDTETRHVSRVSLNGGLVERLLNEAVQLKSGLPWRRQDDRDAGFLGYLLRRTANMDWK